MQMGFKRLVDRVPDSEDEDDVGVHQEPELRMNDLYTSDKNLRQPNESIVQGKNFDTLREESGRVLPDVRGLPLSLDQNCLSH